MRLHAGIDFGAPVGSPVRAVEDGKVEIAGEVSGFGNHVRIQHKGFETSYSHLSEILVTTHPGAEVKRGDLIAYSGNTGLSTGPHLHFEFYLERTAVDPLPHMGGEALAGGPIGRRRHTSRPRRGAAAAGPRLLTPQEIAEFPAFKAQIDAVLAAGGARGERTGRRASGLDDDRRLTVSRPAVEDDHRHVVAGASLEEFFSTSELHAAPGPPHLSSSAISSSLR